MYNYPSDFYDTLTAVIGVFVVFFAICLIFSFILYLLRSIGLYGLAKNRGMKGAGIAWIPFFGVYAIGAVADDISEKSGSKTFFRFLILGGTILSNVLSGVYLGTGFFPMITSIINGGIDAFGYDYDRFIGSNMLASTFSSIGGLISFATFIIMIVSLNKIYKCYRPNSSTGWTVLSVIFPFMQSIFPFMIRNDIPAAPWIPQQPAGYYPPQQPGGYYQQPPAAAPYNPYQQPQTPPPIGPQIPPEPTVPESNEEPWE